jgi:hypothetical protein
MLKKGRREKKTRISARRTEGQLEGRVKPVPGRFGLLRGSADNLRDAISTTIKRLVNEELFWRSFTILPRAVAPYLGMLRPVSGYWSANEKPSHRGERLSQVADLIEPHRCGVLRCHS